MRGLSVAINHRRTSSRDVRDRHDDLFGINSLDVFIRHSCANHRRETIAFPKRRQASAERFAMFLVWKNFIKRRWEKRCRKTPAMLRGLVARGLSVQDVPRESLFPGLVDLPTRWKAYYWRRVTTPVLGTNRRHHLKYAF
jgi:hypothetical protein